MQDRNEKFRHKQRCAQACRVRPWLEALEERAVPTTLPPGLAGAEPLGGLAATVYVETNSPTPGQNAVLAFRQDQKTGGLTQIGTFKTDGTGQINLPKVIGPDDSSQEVVASANGRFLFAVNQGSNTIAAFRIEGNGGLHLVGTFDSGGVQPDSIGIAGDRLYVSNRGDSAVGHPGTVAPNITGFRVHANGALDLLPDATVTFPIDTSPSQNLISRDGQFLFADIFAVPGSTAAQGNTFAPFRIQSNGDLAPAPGGSVGAPVSPPLLLGADTNPRLPIIYAGLTAANEIGVFTFDASGQLTFVGAAPDQGKASCWIVVSADGKYLYSGDTGSNTVGVFSLADPLHPVEIQNFALGGPQAPPGSPAGTRQTAVFQLAFSPDGHTLYAIDQSTDPTGAFAEGNQLHALSVAGDGTLSEPAGPVLLSAAGVPGTAHPQGIAVVDHAFASGSAGHSDASEIIMAMLNSQHKSDQV